MSSSDVVFGRGRDQASGREFLELSLDGDDLCLPYFHRECWSLDDRYLLCTAHGRKQTFLCDLQAEAAQPLEQAWDGPVAYAHWARRQEAVWFVRGREIWLGRPGGRAERVHAVSAEGEVTDISPNASDSGLAFILRVAGLLKRIAYVDLASGAETICCEGSFRWGHVQMCPTRDDLILHADQHDGENHQRMYSVLTNGREHFPFYAQRHGEWVTHECWTRDGRCVTFIRHPHGLAVVDAEGANPRYFAGEDYWHCHGGNTAELIAVDGWRGRVLMLRPADGERRLLSGDWYTAGRMIEAHHLHAHPVLSRSERLVAHNDARSGAGRVRVFNLADLDW